MANGSDFELTMAELRIVARYAVESAQEVLPLFEEVDGADPRPRAAVEAAREFADGAPRTVLQRTTSLAAHRAAKDVHVPSAHYAARAAGDAASAAYLHPIARATQVGHILRVAANASRATELSLGDDPDVGDALIEMACRRATPALIAVLIRYPLAPAGQSRVSQLMNTLDNSLRMPR